MVGLYISGLFRFAAAHMHASDLTFGRNMAEYRQLVEWLAIVSLALWAAVFITMLARVVVCHVWYRYRYPRPRGNPPT